MREIKLAIAAVDAALKRSPDNAALRKAREQLACELASVERGGDALELCRRLEELERRMNEPGADADLLKEYDELRERTKSACVAQHWRKLARPDGDNDGRTDSRSARRR